MSHLKGFQTKSTKHFSYQFKVEYYVFGRKLFCVEFEIAGSSAATEDDNSGGG